MEWTQYNGVGSRETLFKKYSVNCWKTKCVYINKKGVININEIWKDVKNYEDYMVSNLGRVLSKARLSRQNHPLPEKILSQHHNSSGYKYVDCVNDSGRKHLLVHRLVAQAFVDNPRNLNEVDHIDTDKDNNCADNLRWCTHSENHLNHLTVELKRQMNTGKHLSPQAKAKLSKPISVFKNGVLLYTFSSYKDLDDRSKEILGEKLYGIYARHNINGLRNDYKGYTFKLA